MIKTVPQRTPTLLQRENSHYGKMRTVAESHDGKQGRTTCQEAAEVNGREKDAANKEAGPILTGEPQWSGGA